MCLIDTLGKILSELKVQYLPEGGIVLLDSEGLKQHSSGAIFNMMASISQIIVEKDQEVYVLAKITPHIYIESKLVGDANLGILKNASSKIAQELRRSASELST